MKTKNNIAYLGLGSNLNQPILQCQNAIDLIAKDPEIKILQQSSFYQTLPLAKDDKPIDENTPWYINLCLEIETNYTVEELLNYLQEIENQMGRVRQKKWESRIIDLDILFLNQEIISEKNLIIPHPEVHKRSFTLIPLSEISPHLIHPQFDKSILELIDNLVINEGEIIKVPDGIS